MQKLLNIYKKTILFPLAMPKEAVLGEISKAAKINTIDTSTFQIVMQPTIADPFAARGRITLEFAESNDDTTLVKCELVPTSITEDEIYLLLFLLGLLTILGLIISQGFYSFLTLACSWILFPAFLHFTQLLSRGKMESFTRFVLSGLKPQKQKML